MLQIASGICTLMSEPRPTTNTSIHPRAVHTTAKHTMQNDDGKKWRKTIEKNVKIF